MALRLLVAKASAACEAMTQRTLFDLAVRKPRSVSVTMRTAPRDMLASRSLGLAIAHTAMIAVLLPREGIAPAGEDDAWGGIWRDPRFAGVT
jgi:hypothetical protein